MKPSGQAGEDAAAEYLIGTGFRIVERNWWLGRTGELDIVALDGDILVIVEVKSARQRRFGDPVERVTPAKQRRLAALAEAYVAQHDVGAGTVRFDVVTVDLARPTPIIVHLQDAFRPDAE